MVNEQINFDGYTFVKDKYGNLHRSVDFKDNSDILSFYSDSIYLSGKFWYDEILTQSQAQLEPLKLREGTKANELFDIIKDGLSDFGQQGNLLEVGCGVGSFLNRLSDTNLSLEGIDISKLSSVVSEMLYGNTKFEISQCEVLDYFNQSANVTKRDFIAAFDFLEHIKMDNLLLKGFKSHLKPKGKLIITIPVFDTSVIENLADEKFLYPEHHLHLYCEEGLDKVLNNIGFKITYKFTSKSGKKMLYILEN